VRDSAQVDAAFKLAEEAHGPVEVVVSNAGITRDQLLALMSEDSFAEELDTTYPLGKIAFRMRTLSWCRRRAAEIGPVCAALIGELLADKALYRLRAAQGVLGPGRQAPAGPAQGRVRAGRRRG
jgi:3-oxoacyl-[acyl-carrier protein] reductase